MEYLNRTIMLRYLTAALVVIGIGLILCVSKNDTNDDTVPDQNITSFEECLAAGYPVQESYPRQCNTPLGQHFTEIIPPGDVVAESWGSVYGTVLLGPTCPVLQDPPDPGCADRPYATRLALTTSDGARVIKEFSSDADGKFSVDVLAGTYAIRSSAAANILPYCTSNDVIHVPINDSVNADVFCDSGIR